MKINEVRELLDDELKQKVYDLKQELFDIRRQKAVGQLEQPVRIRQIRKDIARCYLVLRERELGIK